MPSNFAGVLAFGSQNISRFSVFLFYTYLLRYTIRTPRAMNPYADSDTTHGLLSPASFSRCQSRAPRRRPAGSHHVQQTCKECQRLSLIDPGLWWTLKTTPLHCRRTHGSMERYVSPPLLLKQQESSGTVRGMKPKGDFTDFWQSLFEFLGIFSM